MIHKSVCNKRKEATPIEKGELPLFYFIIRSNRFGSFRDTFFCLYKLLAKS